MQHLGEAGQNFAACSPDVRATVERWQRDIAGTAPEAEDWRWSIIALELDGLMMAAEEPDNQPSTDAP